MTKTAVNNSKSKKSLCKKDIKRKVAVKECDDDDDDDTKEKEKCIDDKKGEKKAEETEEGTMWTGVLGALKKKLM